MKKYLLAILLGLSIGFSAQTTPKEKALAYFNSYNSKKKITDLILKSFPNLEDAKNIFTKTEDAVQFMKLMEATKKKMEQEPVTDDAIYLIVDINTFTIEDIKEQKTNYNLGLLEILPKFKPGIRFYTVKLMNDNALEQGFSYIYWMFINNKWVFISRPNLAFRK